MKPCILAIAALSLCSTVAAESLFVSGSFAKDKVQSKLQSDRKSQDSDFYAFRGGVKGSDSRYYVEYSHAKLKREAKTNLLSLNWDYMTPITDHTTLLTGAQIAAASLSAKHANSKEGWGLGARVGLTTELCSKARIETGYQVTRTQGLEVNQERLTLIRGAYIALNFDLE